MKQTKKITRHLLLLILFLCIKSMYGQQICQNGGFEDGSTGYQGYYGLLNLNDPNYCTPNIIPNQDSQFSIPNLSPETVEAPFVIVPNIQDPYTSLQMVDTGSSAIRINQRLGDNTDHHEAMLKKNFTATSDVNSVSFRFAYVIEALGITPSNAGSHNSSTDDDAYIKASIHNGAGEEITSLDSRFCLRANIFDCIFQEGTGGAYYTDWATVTLEFDSTQYIGQQLSLRIEVSDCSVEEHYSYAYVDNICTSLQEEPAGLLCCTDSPNELFNIEPSGLLGGADPCDDTTKKYNFVVRNFINQTVNNTTYPGVEFLWTNNTTGETGFGSSFQAKVNEDVSVILTINGCSADLEANRITCDTTNICENCNEADSIINGIISSFSEVTGSCGLYNIAFANTSTECNDVAHIFWENNTDFEELAPGETKQNQYTNGTFTPKVKLYRDGTEINNFCLEETIPQFTVNCDETSDTCENCNEADSIITGIISSFNEVTGSCGLYNIAFASTSTDCNDVAYIFWENNTDFEELAPGQTKQNQYTNGTFTPKVKLYRDGTEISNLCLEETIPEFTVNCDDTTDCSGCDFEIPIFLGITRDCKISAAAADVEIPACFENVTYNWDFNNEATGTGQYPALQTPSMNGQYTVTLTFTYNINGVPCSTVTTDTFNVRCLLTDTDECPDCIEIGTGITVTANNCGEYTINVPYLGKNCYDVDVNLGDGSDTITLFTGPNTVNYIADGTFSTILSISQNDNKCFSQSLEVTVDDCLVPSGCYDCGTVYQSRQNNSPKEKEATTSNKSSTLTMYPNPFTNQFKIESTEDTQIKSLEIFNVYGKLMQSQAYTIGESVYFSKGASGLYFVKVYLLNGEVEIIKLIKK